MVMPFHEGVPDWIVKNLHGTQCNKCSHPITKDDISAIGMRRNKNNAITFIEYECSSCSDRMTRAFNREMMHNVEELCYLLLEEIKRKRTIRNSSIRNRSKNTNKPPISDKEIKSIKLKLKKSKTHHDFMKHIGALDFFKMLEKYRIRRTNES